MNESLTTGTFPTGFKTALVRPLLKKPSLDRDIRSHYRPVSNLSFLGKVLERTAAVQLTKHMMTHVSMNDTSLHFAASTAWTRHRSRYRTTVMRAIDDGCGVLLVLLNFSSAFDTLDHEMLLQRLEESVRMSGITLPWMKPYLRGRSQCVVVDGVKSDPATLQ